MRSPCVDRRHEPPEPDTPEFNEIVAEAAAVDKENNWGAYRRKAGFETYAIAALLFVIPKIGPLKLVDVKGPTTATEGDYMHSVALSITILRGTLARFTPPSNASTQDERAATPPATLLSMIAATSPDILLRSKDPMHPLPNRDLDTGRVVQPGGYSLTDSTYAQLLHRITQQPTQAIPPGIKREIQAYYANPDAPIATKKNPAQWAQVQADLTTLAAMKTSNEPEPYPTYGDDAQNSQ